MKQKPKLPAKINAKVYVPVILLVSLVGTYLVMSSQAAVAPNQVTFENGSTAACTGGVNTTSGNSSFTPTTERAHEGTYSAKASFTGGTSNAYARCVVTTSWNTGDEVWYGGAFFLPTGFASSMQNQVDLMRWDNYSLNNASQDWGGIIIQNSDKQARLKRFNVSNDFVDLSTPFTFPENRWVWVEVRQKLSPTNGQAINEVWIDGTLQSSSTTANTYGREITRIRYGLVAIGEGSQTNPLNLWVDRATVSNSKLGPLGAPSCDFATYGMNNWPPACARPFAPTSPFNREVPSDPALRPLLPNSAQKVAYLTGLGAPQPSPIGTSLAKDYQHPYYFATASDRLVTVNIKSGTNNPATCSTNGWDGGNVDCRKIRIPKDAQTARGGDGHIAIVQPTSDPSISPDVAGYVVGLYDADFTPAGGWVEGQIINAQSGGKSHASTGTGIDAGNTTAASFNNLAGVIRAQEMTEGVINHALFGIVRCTNGHVYPVPNSNEAETCSDGVLPGGYTVNSGGNSVPLGARLWLEMTPSQIDALSIPQWKKTILKAIAKYGVLIGDTGAYSNSTFSFGFMFESSATYTSFGALDQMSAFAADNGFTKSTDVNYPYSAALGNIVDSTNSNIWGKYLRVLDPCVSQGTCSGAPTPTCSTLQGDANNDNVVNISDISAILALFGQTQTTNCADVTKDQTINIQDISLVLANYGNRE